MADRKGRIDYGDLFEKMAGDAGKYARKGFDAIKGVATKDNAEKVGDVFGNVVKTAKGMADSAVQGWNATNEEDRKDPPSDHLQDAARNAAKKVRETVDTVKKAYNEDGSEDGRTSGESDAAK